MNLVVSRQIIKNVLVTPEECHDTISIYKTITFIHTI
jgi:hypothetical protein